MRGCAGAGSTHAAGAHPGWRSTLASTFTGLGFSRTLIALVFLIVLCARLPCPGTCLNQAGARFGLALASGCLCLLRLSLDLSRLGLCQFGFGGGSRPLDSSFLQMRDWMPPILNKWTCLRQVGARFGLGLASGCSCLLSFSLPGVRARRVQGLDLGLEGIVQARRVFKCGGGSEASSVFQMVRWLEMDWKKAKFAIPALRPLDAPCKALERPRPLKGGKRVLRPARVKGLGIRVCRVEGSGFSAKGSRLRVYGLGFGGL